MHAAAKPVQATSDPRTSRRLAIKREERSKKKKKKDIADDDTTPDDNPDLVTPRKRGRPRKNTIGCRTVVKTEKVTLPPPPRLPSPDTEVFCEVMARVSEALLNALPGGVPAVIQQISEQCRVCWQKSAEDDFLIQGDWPNIVEARQLLQQLLQSASAVEENYAMEQDNHAVADNCAVEEEEEDSKANITLVTSDAIVPQGYNEHPIVDERLDDTDTASPSNDEDASENSTAIEPVTVHSRRGLHRRVTSLDPQRADHTCDKCGYKSTRKGVKKHTARYHTPKQYVCDVCNLKFGVRYDMRRHRLTHFDQQGALTDAGLTVLKHCRPGVSAMMLSELEPFFEPSPEKDENDVQPPNEIRQLFADIQHVDTQIVSANQMWSYVCEFCDIKHTTQEMLLEHIATAHAQMQGENTNDIVTVHAMCELCGLRDKATEIVLHLSSAHTDTHYCHLCNISITGGDAERDAHLQQHLASLPASDEVAVKKSKVRKPPKEVVQLTCKLCQRQFVQQSSLSIHMRSHRVKPLLQCEKCDFSTQQRGVFNQHQQRKHNSKISPCNLCPTICSSEQNLQFHMKSVHCDGAKHECTHCGRMFTTKRFLGVHERRVHFAEKRYFCGVCGKGFFEKVRMVEHEYVHRGEEQREASKQFTCSYCGKRFLRKTNMQQHENIHTGRKPYACRECGKAFCYTAELRKHMSVHSDERPHRCQHCGKAFKFRYKLTAHVTMHTKQSRHRCAACGKSFTVLSTLKRHRCRAAPYGQSVEPAAPYGQSIGPAASTGGEFTNADGGVMYMCGVCNELFADQSAVNTHMLSHDPTATPTNMAAIAMNQMTTTTIT